MHRCFRVVASITLDALTEADLRAILQRALRDEHRGLGRYRLALPPEPEEALIQMSDGDARASLNNLEMAAFLALGRLNTDTKAKGRTIIIEDIQRALTQKACATTSKVKNTII